MSNDEPEYLRALRRAQERAQKASESANAGGTAKAPPTPAERDATRWAREVGGKDVAIPPSVAGTKCAILLHPITPFGPPRVRLEWVADRTALAARVNQAAGSGENVMGCYELTTGRPLTAAVEGGKVTFSAGKARQLTQNLSPEKMLRQAAAQAAQMAKTRKLDDRPGGSRAGGGGGRGQRGGR